MDRERLKAAILARYSPRVHMSLILSACAMTSMLASWSMLHFGVTSMLVRYPVALLAAYGMFLLGVWVWLQACDLGPLAAAGAAGAGGAATVAAAKRRRKSKGNGFDIDLPTGGGGGGGGGGSAIPNIARGGGTFDGGGASGGWGGPQANLVGGNLSPSSPELAVPAPKVSGGGGGGGFSIDLDGEAIVVLLLAAALIALIALCSGYLIWSAPDVLAEAAFGAALTGTLARPTRQQTALGWVAGVVKKTWWPFAIVLVAACAFAFYAGKHYPQAHTFKQAIAAALESKPEKP